MTLPKFTAGQVGKLEFHHLNEAFERIERLDGNPALVAASGPVLGRVILVEVLARNGSAGAVRGSFKEVALSTVGSNSYVAVSGGVTSTVSGDAFGAPIVFPCPPVGAIVPVLGHIAANGKLYFRECSSPASVRLGKISSSAQIGTSSKWIYNLTEVVVNNFSQGTYTSAGAGSFQALNGCEEPADVVANRNIGVGTIYPTGATASRKAIKNDTIVLCLLAGTDYVFSIPNGYEFACT
jgi:hypothetical protein